MTRDDIIRIARKAGSSHEGPLFVPDAFVLRFAHLIEEHLRFDSIHSCGNDCQRPACVQGREQRARIYEECAQIAEGWLGPVRDRELHIAAAIRARSK
jgi:hypothetical protein